MLGRWLRKRYNHLLPQEYSLYDIYVQSTDVDRTLMSAEANLAGLYPPRGDQVWDELKWMPIPIHTIPQKLDNILGMQKFCPRYNRELKKAENSEKMKRINENNKDLYAYLTLHSGGKIFDLQSVEYLYNVLFIEVSVWSLEQDICI